MVSHNHFDNLGPSFSTYQMIVLEGTNLDAYRQKGEDINAYLQKQAAIAAQLASLSLDALKGRFEETRDYDEAWEIACAIADEIGDEAAAPYFARVNAIG